MKKILVVIDMQNDFITGSLGSPLTQAVVPNVVKKCQKYKDNGDIIFFTYDTHYDNYFDTLEGKKLPIKHCAFGETGWQVIPELDKFISEREYDPRIYKETFGDINIDSKIAVACQDIPFDITEEDFEIELIGVCTDICVVSNALILRASFPNTKITVDASCCAGTSVEAHQAALTVMKSCQIDVIGE